MNQARIFLLADLQTRLLYFPESRKKNKSSFYPPTISCLVEKKIFLRFCLCIFESDTVKSDCPV